MWSFFDGEGGGSSCRWIRSFFRFFTLSCGIKIITYKIGIEKEHYLLQNVSCLKLRTEVE